jgi:diacylglycerol kinase family enzyme
MGAARRVRVFLNDRSGTGEVSPDALCAAFASHGCACEVTALDGALDLRRLAQDDAAEVAWIAAGGDGTIHTIAQGIAGSERLLGVLPVGTLNHFARDLGLPLELDRAIAIAATGSVRRIDAAEVNGEIFVNNSSLGVYPAALMDRERMKKSRWNKWGAMVLASAKAFVRFRCLEVEYEVQGEARHCKTPLLFVGNNAYALEGGKVGQRERLDAGLLFVLLVVNATRFGMLRLFAAALVGRARHFGDLEEFSAASFTVKASGKRLRVAFDGELRRMPGPLCYKSLPGALRVIGGTP